MKSQAVEIILRTKLANIKPTTLSRHSIPVATAKTIRDTFRQLGWAKYLRVLRGGGSLGTSISWQDSAKPCWACAEDTAAMNLGKWRSRCLCAECEHGRRQREAVKRRVHYVLQQIFANQGHEFGDRSDMQSDYFDSDYTFYA